jgi:hypothetical protein
VKTISRQAIRRGNRQCRSLLGDLGHCGSMPSRPHRTHVSPLSACCSAEREAGQPGAVTSGGPRTAGAIRLIVRGRYPAENGKTRRACPTVRRDRSSPSRIISAETIRRVEFPCTFVRGPLQKNRLAVLNRVVFERASLRHKGHRGLRESDEVGCPMPLRKQSSSGLSRQGFPLGAVTRRVAHAIPYLPCSRRVVAPIHLTPRSSVVERRAHNAEVADSISAGASILRLQPI